MTAPDFEGGNQGDEFDAGADHRRSAGPCRPQRSSRMPANRTVPSSANSQSARSPAVEESQPRTDDRRLDGYRRAVSRSVAAMFRISDMVNGEALEDPMPNSEKTPISSVRLESPTYAARYSALMYGIGSVPRDLRIVPPAVKQCVTHDSSPYLCSAAPPSPPPT